MKKFLLLTGAVLMAVLSLQNCKPDKTEGPSNPNDPDSLYAGTSYSFSTLNPPPFRFPLIEHPYKDSLTLEGIELGRRLFYDKHLSSTGLLSCASCHKQEFAFSDGGNAKSTNVFGPTKRNAPAVQNLLWATHTFWDGRANSMAAAAKDAYHGEQNMDPVGAIQYFKTDSTYTRLFRKVFGRPGDISEDKIYLAIQEFMMTMISYNSHFDKVQRGQEQFTASEQRGFDIFLSQEGECVHCHTAGNNLLLAPTNLFQNNGLDAAATINDFADKGRGEITGDGNDYGKFKVPSLRNVALTAPYMHDGRFQTLEQVIAFYSDSAKTLSPNIDGFNLGLSIHPEGKFGFDDQQKEDLLNFLRSLTDTTFTHNPAFSNPF
jgi:cytochrome c peroxidase